MQNSSSFNSLIDIDDLDLYKQEITKQRCSRTLSLRQYTRKINLFQTSGSQPLQTQITLSSSHDQLINISSFPFLNNEYLLTLLDQGNVSQFSQVLHQIEIQCSESPRVLKKMLGNEKFYDSLNEIFTAHFQSNNYPVVVQIINFLIIIFPFVFPTIQSYIIDNIIFSSLTDLLTSTDSLTVTAEAMNLSAVISENSSYARDTILCSGIHTIIIDIAVESDLNTELLEIACKSLLAIFGNPSPIESNDILIDSIQPLYSLLDHCLSLDEIIVDNPKVFAYPQNPYYIPSNDEDKQKSNPTLDWGSLNESGICHLSAASNIIDCYVLITNNDSSIIYNIFTEKIGIILISFLDDDSMVLSPSAIRLIGNLCVSQKHEIQENLIQAGLLPKLINLINSPLAADVFWCFSNLLESSPLMVVPLFQDQTEFISKIVEITIESSIDVKRESSYFLSSLIIFASTNALPEFLENPEIVDILVEMLGCGVASIIIRCLDCLKKLLLFCHTNICRSDLNPSHASSHSHSSDSLFSLESSDIDGNDASQLFSSFLSNLFESELRDRIDDIIDDQKDKIMYERALIVAKLLDEIQSAISYE